MPIGQHHRVRLRRLHIEDHAGDRIWEADELRHPDLAHDIRGHRYRILPGPIIDTDQVNNQTHRVVELEVLVYQASVRIQHDPRRTRLTGGR